MVAHVFIKTRSLGVSLHTIRDCRGKRTRSDQLLPGRIHDQVQPLQCARTQQRLVSWFTKHDLIDGEPVFYADNRETDATCYHATVCHQKLKVLFLPNDANFLQRFSGNPRELASGVDKGLGNADSTVAVDVMLNFALDVESTHSNILTKPVQAPFHEAISTASFGI